MIYQKEIERQNGITLIALIVSIIIMVIVSGITLTVTVKEDGILSKVQEATILSRKSKQEEKIRIVVTELKASNVFEDENKEYVSETLQNLLDKTRKKIIVNEGSNSKFFINFIDTSEVYYVDCETAKIEYAGIYENSNNDIEIKDADVQIVLSNTNYTNQNIIAKVKLNNIEYSEKLNIQYKFYGEKKWDDYNNENIIIEKNGQLLVRLITKDTGITKYSTLAEISNIDKLSPYAELKVVNNNTYSTTIQVDAKDNDSKDYCSTGIKGYYYSMDGKNYTIITNNNFYTYDNLIQGTNYDFFVKIEDTVGNITERKISSSTNLVASANESNVNIKSINWNGIQATVSFDTKTEFSLQLSLDKATWINSNELTVDSGTQIFARLYDSVRNSGSSYAICKPVLKYTIKFNGNNSSKGEMENIQCNYGETFNLSENKYSRTGYKFIGWSTSRNANVEYTNCQSVSNLAQNNDEEINLYAVWTLGDALKIAEYDYTGNYQTFAATEERIVPD